MSEGTKGKEILAVLFVVIVLGIIAMHAYDTTKRWAEIEARIAANNPHDEFISNMAGASSPDSR